MKTRDRSRVQKGGCGLVLFRACRVHRTSQPLCQRRKSSKAWSICLDLGSGMKFVWLGGIEARKTFPLPDPLAPASAAFPSSVLTVKITRLAVSVGHVLKTCLSLCCQCEWHYNMSAQHLRTLNPTSSSSDHSACLKWQDRRRQDRRRLQV